MPTPEASATPALPDQVTAAVKAGHALESDPPAALTAVRRWTCTTCGDAVLLREGHAYGGATERTCEESQAFWRSIG